MNVILSTGLTTETVMVPMSPEDRADRNEMLAKNLQEIDDLDVEIQDLKDKQKARRAEIKAQNLLALQELRFNQKKMSGSWHVEPDEVDMTMKYYDSKTGELVFTRGMTDKESRQYRIKFPTSFEG